MNWKNKLKELEDSELWDDAVEFVQDVIKNNPDDADAYLAMNFLLMNILSYGDHGGANMAYYSTLVKDYFDESYAKFSDNSEYLFFTAMTGYFAEWLFGLETEDLYHMRTKALQLDPNNLLYKWASESDDKKYLEYCRQIIAQDSPYRKFLETKGSLGEYFLDRMGNVVAQADRK